MDLMFFLFFLRRMTLRWTAQLWFKTRSTGRQQEVETRLSVTHPQRRSTRAELCETSKRVRGSWADASAARRTAMDWGCCVDVTPAGSSGKHEEKKWKSCREFEQALERRCDLFLRFASVRCAPNVCRGKAICVCSSATLLSHPRLLSHCLSWLTGLRRLQIALSTQQALLSLFGYLSGSSVDTALF